MQRIGSLATNVIVSSMLILGGSATVTSLTGMPALPQGMPPGFPPPGGPAGSPPAGMQFPPPGMAPPGMGGPPGMPPYQGRR